MGTKLPKVQNSVQTAGDLLETAPKQSSENLPMPGRYIDAQTVERSLMLLLLHVPLVGMNFAVPM